MSNHTYCNFDEFRDAYKNYHGYLSLPVCIIGSFANILNICVLCRKQMRSPTNLILTGLAISDLLVMLQYIPFVFHRNLSSNRKNASHFSYSWAIFYKYHAVVTLALHFISCCLTLVLALWRYMYVSKVHRKCICTNYRITFIVIILIFIICPIFFIPSIMTLSVKDFQQTVSKSGVMVLKKDVAKHNQSELEQRTIYMVHPNNHHHLNVWIYTLLGKIIPCIVLTILSYLIISVLVETKRRRLKLMQGCSALETLNNKHQDIQIYKENQADRTTKMLLVVLLLFLITEFPQAILAQMSLIYGDRFLEECYATFGDVIDLVTLINSSINFVLYCAMSRQFRVTFQEMIRMNILIKWFPVTQHCQEENGIETKMSLV